MTSDGVPVLWHDDTLLTLASEGNVQQNEIGEITLEDFRALGSGVQVTRHETNQLLARKFSGSNELIPWTCVSKIEESFQRNGGQPTTLQEALMVSIVSHHVATNCEIFEMHSWIFPCYENNSSIAMVVFWKFDTQVTMTTLGCICRMHLVTCVSTLS